MEKVGALGKSTNNMDSKYRVIFPVKLREELGSPVVITVAKGGCLEAYSIDEWHAFMAKLRALPKSQKEKVHEIFCGMASKCDYDASGRILLTEEQVKYASIKKAITFIGCDGTVKMWAAENAPIEKISPEDVDDAYNVLDEFGI